MRIALSQLAAGVSPEQNLRTVVEQTERAARQGAELVVFPEATMARFGVPLAPLAEPLDGPWARGVHEVAARTGVLVVAGMFTPHADGRVRNTLLVTGPDGSTHYDKVHLFDAFDFAESATVAPGERLVTAPLGELPLGFATCYDVRFPELFRALADRGARVVVLAASWGAGPGKLAQWEVLVRARALDSGCWVLAAGQADPATVGEPPATGAPTGIGHSMVVSPLGEVVARLAGAPGLLLADLDPAAVDEARRTVPTLRNRRPELY
ncbi:carbon-nitrogen hydrolase family protein [Streptomyces sp. DSM 44915]|uniref:Carbon-nitrogen hydrolase family protein n=1 Tax=Streptomyces chisholmiae TaxID=3075540 RepID=A0ABU2JWP9_9ACTN|nr:carbon-nitrogen hydrolase family protein [Streptomyces sp. DSM 44915]MDT0269427.1 carbon-nitrogen hydrolase family protein [Streptomyces sp. DSM 44915]